MINTQRQTSGIYVPYVQSVTEGRLTQPERVSKVPVIQSELQMSTQ